MNKFIFNEVFQPAHIDDMSGDDPLVQQGKKIQVQFTALVDMMRTPQSLPLPVINNLMALCWDLVGNRICPTGVVDVPVVSFYAERRQDRSIAAILVPPKWPDWLAVDPLYHMGGLAFVASQAKDYWNNKFVPGGHADVKRRALSTEAELLHFFARTVPDFKPNEYQQKVINEFPHGIASEGSHYESRPYAEGAYPPYPLDIHNLQ